MCARLPLAALRVTQCERTDQWTCISKLSLTSALHGREMISVTPRPLHPPVSYVTPIGGVDVQLKSNDECSIVEPCASHYIARDIPAPAV